MPKAEILVDTSSLADAEFYAGIEISTDEYLDTLGHPKGSVVIIGLTANPFKNKQNVVIRMKEQEVFHLARIDSHTDEKMLLITHYATNAPMQLIRENIAQIYAIKMIVAPD